MEPLDSQLNDRLIDTEDLSMSIQSRKVKLPIFAKAAIVLIVVTLFVIVALQISQLSVKDRPTPCPTCAPPPPPTSTSTPSPSPSPLICPFRPRPLPFPSGSGIPQHISAALTQVDSLADSFIKKIGPVSGLTGISLGVTYRDELIHSSGTGYVKKDFPTTSKPDKDTIYRIASITKEFVALSLEILSERGIIDMNDPISKHEPRFHIPNEFDGTNITFAQVIAQMSGMPREMPCGIQCAYTDDEMYEIVKGLTLILPPWTKPSYSNAAFAIAGHVIETITQLSFEDFCELNIMGKLDMKSTGGNYSKPGVVERMADGFYSPGKILPDPTYDTHWIAPAAQFYSTVDDLSKLVIALMDWNHTSPYTYTHTYSTPMSPPSLGLGLSPSHLRQMALVDYYNPTGKTAFGRPFECEIQHGFVVRRKGGNLPGYSSVISYIPEIHLGFVAMFNAGADEASFLSSVMDILIPAFLTDLTVIQQSWMPPTPPNGPHRFIGSYGTAPGGAAVMEVVSVDGRLFLYGPTMPAMEMGFNDEHVESSTNTTTARFRLNTARREAYPQNVLDVIGPHIILLDCMRNELLSLDGSILKFSNCDLDTESGVCVYMRIEEAMTTLVRV